MKERKQATETETQKNRKSTRESYSQTIQHCQIEPSQTKPNQAELNQIKPIFMYIMFDVYGCWANKIKWKKKKQKKTKLYKHTHTHTLI